MVGEDRIRPVPEKIYPELSPTTIRLPFHYPSNDCLNYNYGTFVNDNPSRNPSPSTENLNQASSVYSRYRYYNRIFNHNATVNGENDKQILIIPDHVIPWYFTLPRVSVGNYHVPDTGSQSSIVTIFAIWNMMMGTSLLCLPWAYHRAGLIGGILAILLMTALCSFTASLVVRAPLIADVKVNEFTDLCAILLGKFAHKISQISSLSIIAGGCIVYWILLNNFLRHILSFVYQVQYLNMTVETNASSAVCAADSIEPTDEVSQVIYKIFDLAVPLILVLVLGPIICCRSVNIFLRFNFIGTISVFYLLAFSLFKAYYWGFDNISFDQSSSSFIKLIDWNFPVYTGVLSLALFIHNCLLTLLRTQQKPQHNQRDLAIAYVLVGITYFLIGTAIYVSFPLEKACLKDNFLDNFESNDLYAFITRLFLLLQVSALFPLLVYMLRIQALSLFENSNNNPVQYQFIRIIILNISLLTICVLFGYYYPQIGTIIRYCGSFSAVILIFTLPSLAYIKARTLSEKPVGVLGKIGFTCIITFGAINFLTQFFVTG